MQVDGRLADRNILTQSGEERKGLFDLTEQNGGHDRLQFVQFSLHCDDLCVAVQWAPTHDIPEKTRQMTDEAEHRIGHGPMGNLCRFGRAILCLCFVAMISGCVGPAVPPSQPQPSPSVVALVQATSTLPRPVTSLVSPVTPIPLQETTPTLAPPPVRMEREKEGKLPTVTALANLNLRIGPGIDYAVAGQLLSDGSAEIHGRTPDGRWWLVADPVQGRQLWVTADPALITVQGDPSLISVVPVPPAPSAPILPLLHELPVGANSIAFSPNNELLAIGATDYTVRVYDTDDWSLRWQAAHTDYVGRVLFSPDGQYLASAGFDGVVNGWEATTGRPRYRLDYDYWAVGPDFSADSLFVASGGTDGRAVVAKMSDGEVVGEYVNDLPIRSLAVSPYGPWLALMTAGSWGPVELAVWDILTHERRVLARYEGLPNQSNVVFSPDMQWLAASLENGGPLRVWQTQTWPEVVQLETGSGHVQQVAFSADGRWLAALYVPSTLDTTVRIWSVPDWQLVSEVTLGDWALDMTFSSDGNTLATAHGQGDPPIPPINEGRVWSVPGGELTARLPHMLQVQGLAFSPDGRWIATGSVDNTTKVWALPTH